MDKKTSFLLTWQEREITVNFEENWLNSQYWHIKLHCAERLPVTETGYRSQFVPADEIADVTEIEAYVLSWLDHAATDKAWLKYVQESRQLSLF